jgi:peptidoglycan/xylan/chitin deacetylase (PgdA/CDA1 family)
MTRGTFARLSTPALRRLACIALRLTLLPWLFREVVQRQKATILVFHAPSPTRFDHHLDVLKRLYRIIPLSSYVQALQHDDFSTLPPKALIITLDDGHRSNYALKDVIEKHNVPVTIFLCTGLIGTHRRFWFLHDDIAACVQQLKTVSDDDRLASLRQRRFDETQEFDERQALSVDEVRALKDRVDFQSHSVFHPILPRCSSERAEAEITQSRRDLLALLDQEIYAFAYPNGDYSAREMRLVEQAGYTCALTLDQGSLAAVRSRFNLPRLCIPDDADRHELLVKTSGLWGLIRAVLHKATCEKAIQSADTARQGGGA